MYCIDRKQAIGPTMQESCPSLSSAKRFPFEEPYLDVLLRSFGLYFVVVMVANESKRLQPNTVAVLEDYFFDY